MKRWDAVFVRLSTAEGRTVRKAAETVGLSVASFVRMKVLAALEREAYEDAKEAGRIKFVLPRRKSAKITPR